MKRQASAMRLGFIGDFVIGVCIPGVGCVFMVVAIVLELNCGEMFAVLL